MTFSSSTNPIIARNPEPKELNEFLEKMAQFIVQKELGPSRVLLLLIMLVRCGRSSTLRVLQELDMRNLWCDSVVQDLPLMADKLLAQELKQYLRLDDLSGL